MIVDHAQDLDAFRTAVQNGIQTSDGTVTSDKAYSGYVSDLQNAWQGNTNGKAA